MVIKSKVDENQYETFALSNGIKVLLIHNPKLTKTSFAVSVKVGSYSDPEKYHGLAHFLEHMLFMGTENFKGEHEFNEFLGQHNGYTNAYTASEMTVYYCDVDSDQSRKLGKMFSSFFICPLFNESTVNRELSAVNSEYLNTLNSAEWRAYALLRDFVKDGMKEKKFSVGNYETLRKDEILDKMKEFYHKWYSSNTMNLVICGPEPIETLKEMTENFKEVPNKNLQIVSCEERAYVKDENPENDAKFRKSRKSITSFEDYNFFDQKFFSKVIQFAPLDDKKVLYIYAVLPPIFPYYRTNPIAYIQSLFVSTEPGRLLSRLKSEGLGFSVSLSEEMFDGCTPISISIELTEAGSKETSRVLDMVKEALSEIKADEAEYKRLKRINQEEFNFLQNSSPIKMTETLVPLLYYIPTENILNYKYVYDEFDPDLINFVVSKISDTSKWIINLADKNGTFDQKEKYYNIEYSIIGDYKCTSESAEIRPFECQGKDEFLENIEVIKGQKRFYKSESFENGKVHFVFDSDFNVPKSEIRIVLRSNEIIKDFVALRIYLDILEEHLKEKFSRLLANLHVFCRSEISHDRIYFVFWGFSSKICYVAKLFMDELYNIPLDRFSVIKEANMDYYSGVINDCPYKRTNRVFIAKLFSSLTEEECLEKAKCIKVEEIKFLKSFYTEIVAVGNINYDDIVDLFNKVKCENLPSSQELLQTSVNTDLDSVSFETPDENNNLLACIYKINDPVDSENSDLRAYHFNTAVGRLIQNICNEDFFKELRTEEQLGYIVFCSFSRFDSAEFLKFVVQSEKSVEFLEARINKFVSDLKENILNMTDDLFETYKESLISFYEEPVLNLRDLGSFIISLYLMSNIDLEYKNKMIKIVRDLTKEDVLKSDILNKYIKLYSIKR